jgi:hypothetical protein
VNLLQPFVVVTWHGADEAAMEPDVREIYTRSDVPKDTNVYAFVLDSHGRLVHGFRGLPGGRGSDRSDYQVELTKARAKLNLTDMKMPKDFGVRPSVLPDLRTSGSSALSGIRLFVRRNDDLFQSRIPIIEVVPMKAEEWRKFSLVEGGSAKTIEAEQLRSWLVHLYPAGIRTAEQMRPFKTILGTLKLLPAGTDERFRYVLLSGAVRLTKEENVAAPGESAFDGVLQAVLIYRRGSSDVSSLRGVVEGVYVSQGRARMELSAALESRPD